MDVHVLSHWMNDHPAKKRYFETHANPLLFPLFNGTRIVANKLHTKLLSYGTTLEEKMYILSKYIGAYRGVPYTGTLQKVHMSPILKVTPSLGTNMFMHGWYEHNGTRRVLEGAIQHYKPKVIMEFGVWYGKSAVGILQSALHKITYIGVDYFTPAATSPKHITQSPLDKLFLDHPRLETAVSNVAPYSKKHNVYFIIERIDKVLSILRKESIVPDLLFIDAIKDFNELTSTINAYIEHAPDIVIVGDDRTSHDVQRAVNKYKQTSLNVKEYGVNGYILTSREIPSAFPLPISTFEAYPTLQLTTEEKNSIPTRLQLYV